MFQAASAELNAGANVALHGPHGVGKSFMISALDTSGSLKRARLMINISVCSSGAEVFRMIVDSTNSDSARADQELGTPPPFSVHDCWSVLQRKGNLGVTLVFDEFDHVVQFADAREFLSHLRELAHNPRNELNLLISSRRPLALIEEDVVGISTLAGLCSAHYLMVVDSSDLIEWFNLPNDAGPLPDPSDNWTCGLPALVASWVRNSCHEDIRPEQALLQIATIDSVLDYLDQLSLLVPCGLALLGMTESVNITDRRILRILRLLPEQDASPRHGCLGEAADFRSAIQFRLMSMPPWDLTHASLNSLRSFVDQVMTGSFGPHWSIDDRAEPAHPVVGGTAGLSVSELWRIVKANWSPFKSYFEGQSIAYWDMSVDLLGRLRRQPKTYATAVTLPFDVAEASRRLEEIMNLQNQPNGRLLEQAGLQPYPSSTLFLQQGGTAIVISENSGAINSGNAGAIVTGSGSISGGSFQGADQSQLNEPTPPIDVGLLTAQLEALRSAMRSSAQTLAQDTVVVQVGQAQAALESGDVETTRSLLSRAGTWVGEIASKVGADLVLKLVNG